MKFMVVRTSLHDRTKQPDPTCYSEIVTYEDRYTIHPKETKESVKSRIIKQGLEIIDEAKHYFLVLRKETRWFIDIDTLDELLEFGDSELIITSPFKSYIEYPDISEIEIYDDYRE